MSYCSYCISWLLFTSAQCTVFCIVSNRQGDTLSRFDSTSMRRVGFNDLVSALSAVYSTVYKYYERGWKGGERGEGGREEFLENSKGEKGEGKGERKINNNYNERH